MSMTLVDRAYDEIVETSNMRRPTIDHIINTVAEYYGFTVEEIRGPSLKNAVTHARHMAVYLILDLTPTTIQEASRAVGRRDHSTSGHAKYAIRAKLETFPSVAAEYEYLRERLARDLPEVIKKGEKAPTFSPKPSGERQPRHQDHATLDVH